MKICCVIPSPRMMSATENPEGSGVTGVQNNGCARICHWAYESCEVDFDLELSFYRITWILCTSPPPF